MRKRKKFCAICLLEPPPPPPCSIQGMRAELSPSSSSPASGSQAYAIQFAMRVRYVTPPPPPPSTKKTDGKLTAKVRRRDWIAAGGGIPRPLNVHACYTRCCRPRNLCYVLTSLSISRIGVGEMRRGRRSCRHLDARNFSPSSPRLFISLATLWWTRGGGMVDRCACMLASPKKAQFEHLWIMWRGGDDNFVCLQKDAKLWRPFVATFSAHWLS